jgi:CheY-like chemotaxis protein
MPSVVGSRPDVVVIEDDAALRDTIAFVLGDAGYEVRAASNGLTGLRLAQTSAPDLLILDLHLPELSGVSVLRELRASRANPDLQVILITGSNESLPEQILRQCAAVLLKPFDVDELVMTTLRVLARLVTANVSVCAFGHCHDVGRFRAGSRRVLSKS